MAANRALNCDQGPAPHVWACKRQRIAGKVKHMSPVERKKLGLTDAELNFRLTNGDIHCPQCRCKLCMLTEKQPEMNPDVEVNHRIDTDVDVCVDPTDSSELDIEG